MCDPRRQPGADDTNGATDADAVYRCTYTKSPTRLTTLLMEEKSSGVDFSVETNFSEEFSELWGSFRKGYSKKSSI